MWRYACLELSGTAPPLLLPQVLNEMFTQDLKRLVSPHQDVDELIFISIDATGVDIRVRTGSEFNVERIGFGTKVHTLEEAIAAVQKVVHTAPK